MKNFARQERTITISRVGNSIYEKTKVGDVEFEIMIKLNEEIEWKDNEENPRYHIKVCTSICLFIYM